MDTKTEQLLNDAGWQVECLSPLEIRHDDGSFATNQAARVLIDSLSGEPRTDKMNAALLGIEATASVGRSVSTGDQAKRMWHEVEKMAKKALAD